VVLDHGGSLSHHHGVGKIRQSFLPLVHSAAGLEAIRAVKRAVDPLNVFGVGNGACRREGPA
jgi:alkyldihydroxyacetonephosphate synthase